jgi:hypothetical protein
VNSHILKFSAMDPTYSLPDNVALLTLQVFTSYTSWFPYVHMIKIIGIILWQPITAFSVFFFLRNTFSFCFRLDRTYWPSISNILGVNVDTLNMVLL